MSSSSNSSSRPSSSRARARMAARSTGSATASSSVLRQGSQTWSTVSEPPLTDEAATSAQVRAERKPDDGGDVGGPVLIEGNEGCWHNFVKTVRAIWRTNMTEDTKTNRELYIKTTLRELIIYCVFLIVLMILSLGMTSSAMYYYTQALTGLFTGTPASDTQTPFTGINSIPGWWSFAKGPLMDGLYWDAWYNSDNFSDPKEKNFIYYDNKLLGVPRIRQLRVRNDSCTVADDFKNEITFCHSAFSPGVEEKRPFGFMNSTAWNYSTEKELDGRSFTGEISSYPGSGYYVDLSRSKDDSLAQINQLFTGLWIDRGTRVVFVDFTVYNANINLFCVVKLAMEFPATGGAIPTSEFRTVKLLRYVEPRDYIVLVCEGIFMLFICYYIVEEVIEIKRNKLAYFKIFWNWLDIIVILVSLVCGAFNVYRTITVGKKLRELLQDETRFPDFDFLSYWQQQFNSAIAFTLFLAWVKFFKYISFNKTMTQLSSTLSACAKDLMGFAVMFFIVFFAFAQLGYLIFGTQIRDFREFHHSVFTLFRIILGDFDFHQLESANRVLGPLFFLLYVFFVFFVLINMFLAIINDTYSEVKTELANQPNEFEMADYFKERAAKVLKKLNLKHEKIVDIQSALKTADMNNDKQLDFEEWRAELKMRGYADGEIEALFAKYDMDGDRVLDEKEQQQMTSELEGQRAEINRQIDTEKVRPSSARGAAAAATAAAAASLEPQVTSEEFSALSRRVDRMERSIGSVVSKIDAVLVKLDAVEAGKVKRREQMGKLLDAINETEGVTDEYKRQEMERMVREQLHRFDAEPSMVVTPQDEAAAAAAAGAASTAAGSSSSSKAKSRSRGRSAGGASSSNQSGASS